MGKEGLSTFQTLSPHPLFLGHCQSVTKASRKVTNGRRGGAGKRQRKTEAEKQEPSSTGPAQKDFPGHCNCHPSLHMEKSAPMEGTQHRKELGIPHYQTKRKKKGI
ncbi:hypothetical protein I79_015150 [Cricetulus griseus]|uniref:Uncharacterized protein n=1 Tax=Cricetulus griseus TaxID=10029 RepID=G3HW03_CRIGR|nr:hypothetical protein I79_015150 [Cricetulus griseus]